MISFIFFHFAQDKGEEEEEEEKKEMGWNNRTKESRFPIRILIVSSWISTVMGFKRVQRVKVETKSFSFFANI